MSEDRPLGVTLVAVLTWISGAFLLFFGIYLGLSSSPLYIWLPGIAISLLLVWAGLGLWSKTENGWKAGIGLYGFSLLSDIFLFLYHTTSGAPRGFPEPSIIRFLLTILIVSYLFNKKDVFFSDSS